MKRVWKDVLNSAIVQHERLDAALASADPRRLGFTQQQSDALTSPFSVRMIITLEDVTVLAPLVSELQDEGTLISSAKPFWVLSLMDLMIITDILRDIDLVTYLISRQRFVASRRFEDHEELRWLNIFLRRGYFTEDREELKEALRNDNHDLISSYYSDHRSEITPDTIETVIPHSSSSR